MRRGVVSCLATLLAGSAGVLLVAPAGAASTREVVGGRAGDFQPALGPEFLAWERDARGSPTRYAVVAKRLGGHRFRVNAPGTQAANGGIDGPLLAYQQFHGRRSDIKLFDLKRRRRRTPPKGVNTPHWEYWPSLSGRWLLFARYKRGGNRKVLLRNGRTGTTRTLAKTGSKNAFLAPGQVNGVWAVYSRCTPATKCDVFRYNLVTKRRSKLPNPGLYQRAPSVTSSGTVYFVRSRRRCGKSVRIVRHAIGGPTTVVVKPPEGTDVGDTYVFSQSARPNRLLFDRRRCRHPRRSNILGANQPRLIAVRARMQGAGGGSVASVPGGIRCGSDCAHSYKAGATVTLTAVPERNANFTGWGGACSGSVRTCTTRATHSRWVIAFFDPASSFSLSVSKRGLGKGKVTSKPAGVDCGNDCWEAYRAGTSVVLTATAGAGSKFSGWGGACRGAGKCRVTMDRVRTVTATFANLTPSGGSRRSLPRHLDGVGSAPLSSSR
jgi:hypothetical protein